MPIPYTEYEIPILKALISSDEPAKTSKVYPVVEEIMEKELIGYPEEYGKYKGGETIWRNKIRWAREYLKRKGQLDCSERGVWKITPSGRERVRIFKETERDPDEGLSKLQGVDTEIKTIEGTPKQVFDKLEQTQQHETGDILGVRGIVYEPINEQGVILLFAALAHELDFRIEAIRSRFPDALLRRKTSKDRWITCKAEFEFRSSEFNTHGHDEKKCDLLICWEHNWNDCPIEVLSLKEAVKDLKD